MSENFSVDNVNVSLTRLKIVEAQSFERDELQKQSIYINAENLKQLRNAVLRGGFSLSPSTEWKSPKWTLRLFVSSTFTDTHAERNVLLDKILPILKEIGRQERIEIVFIDMRYGVRDENTIDHLTWIACYNELKRCRDESAGLYFLSLQSNKYGYQPIPKYLAKVVFDKLYITWDNETQQIAKEWYILDENSIPHRYVLKNLASANDSVYWTKVLPIMRQGLNNIAFDENKGCENLLIGRSVTEWEARFALSDPSYLSRCLWIKRSFIDEVTIEHDPRKEYNDSHDDVTKEKLENLKYDMQTQLESTKSIDNKDCIIKNSITIDSYLKKDNVEWDSYITNWEQSTKDRLKNEIYLIKEKRQQWLLDGYGIGIKGEELDEMLRHCELAADKCSDFEGREELIKQSLQVINNENRAIFNENEKTDKDEVEKEEDEGDDDDDDDESSDEEDDSDDTLNGNFDGISLQVVGESGSGKTGIMAKLASEVYNLELLNSNPRPVIIRFCGTSEKSGNGISLLTSICYQLHQVLGINEKLDFDSYKQVVKKFHYLISRYPVIVFIDSLDQLSDQDFERSKLSFLAGVLPHKDSRIVVSVLTDCLDNSSESNRPKYCYGCDILLRKNNVPRTEVQLFNSDSREEAKHILLKLLEHQSRSLANEQLNNTLNQVRDGELSVLYLKLLVHKVSKWTSFHSDDYKIADTVPGLVNQIFDDLERDFGKILVRASLGFIALSVGGVNDNHMQDLLSLDPKVEDDVFQYSKPNVRRIPIHVWIRLKNALFGLIVERENGKVSWYHRQLKEIALDRYKVEKVYYHEIMGKYFANIISPEIVNSKLISKQIITSTDSIPIWFSHSEPNISRCLEAAHHLLESNLLEEAINELCYLDNICALVKVGEGFSLVKNLIKLFQKVKKSDIVISKESIERVDHYLQWLRLNMSIINFDPSSQIFATCTTNQPIVSSAYKDICTLFIEENKTYTKASMSDWFDQKTCWFRPISLVKLEKFDSVYSILQGHTKDVYCTNFDPKKNFLASGSSDHSVIIWDSVTGEPITTLKGHSSEVYCLSYSYDGKMIASGGRDLQIIIWDTQSYLAINNLEGHSDTILSLDFNRDPANSNQLVSCSLDKSIKIFDVKTGKVLFTFQDGIQGSSACFFKDGKLIISGGVDTLVKLWKINSDSKCSTCKGHKKDVTTVDSSYSGNLIASGSEDKTVIIWNAKGKKVNTFHGHTDKVTNVKFNPNDSLIASSSDDLNIILWDFKTKSCLVKLRGGFMESINAVDFSSDKKFLVGCSSDFSIRLWDIDMTIANKDSVNSSGFKDTVRSICFNSTGSKLFSCCDDGFLKVWDFKTSKELKTLEHFENQIQTMCLSIDNTKIAYGSDDGSTIIRDVSSGQLLYNLKSNKKSINKVLFNFNNKHQLITASTDKTVKIWDIENNQVVKVFKGHKASVNCICYDKKTDIIYSASNDKTIRSWSVKTGKEIKCIKKAHTTKVNCIEIHPVNNNLLLSGAEDGDIKQWSVTISGDINFVDSFPDEHDESVNSIVFNNNGTLVLTASDDESIIIWDFNNRLMLHCLEGHTDWVQSAIFSPDGNHIVSASDDMTVKVWDSVKLLK